MILVLDDICTHKSFISFWHYFPHNFCWQMEQEKMLMNAKGKQRVILLPFHLFLRLFLRHIVCFKHQRFFLGLQWQFWDRKYRTSTNRIVRSMSLPFSCIYFPRAFTYANVACHECHSAWQSTFGKVAVPVAWSLFFFLNQYTSNTNYKERRLFTRNALSSIYILMHSKSAWWCWESVVNRL